MMYSRVPDRSSQGRPLRSRPDEAREPVRHVNGYHQGRQGVYIPPNYSGTAIGREPEPQPHFDDLPRVGELTRGIPDAHTLSDAYESEEALERAEESEAAIVSEQTPEISPKNDASLPAGLFGGLTDSKHFPFGHGLGFEELLLLGLILFLLREGEEDQQENKHGEGSDLHMTLLLLGALLFCG